MAKFYICTRCGAHLDHGEQCDCIRKEVKDAGRQISKAERDAQAAVVQRKKNKKLQTA